MRVVFPPNSARGLWQYFILVVGLSLAFGLTMIIWDFVVIDELINAEAIREHVSDMSAEQRRAHIGATLTLDIIYPFVYAGLFAGLTLKAWPDWRYLAAPILLCIPVDLIEGMTQVMILNGHFDWIDLKTLVTPIKLVLFIAGSLVAIAALLCLAIRHVKMRKRSCA